MVQPAPRPVPEGMNTLTAMLFLNGNCRQAIEFYQKAFGAELMGPIVPGPDGKGVMHAMLKFGNSHIMLADAMPGEWLIYRGTGTWGPRMRLWRASEILLVTLRGKEK